MELSAKRGTSVQVYWVEYFIPPASIKRKQAVKLDISMVYIYLIFTETPEGLEGGVVSLLVITPT